MKLLKLHGASRKVSELKTLRLLCQPNGQIKCREMINFQRSFFLKYLFFLKLKLKSSSQSALDIHALNNIQLDSHNSNSYHNYHNYCSRLCISDSEYSERLPVTYRESSERTFSLLLTSRLLSKSRQIEKPKAFDWNSEVNITIVKDYSIVTIAFRLKALVDYYL